MRKIYSLVLLAAALLVGTNAWAETRTAANATEFKTAWQASVTGDVIQLTDTIQLNEKFTLSDGRDITLDLNGKNLVFTCQPKTSTVTYDPWLFEITHGKLHVISSTNTEGQIRNTTVGNSDYKYNGKGVHVVYLMGSTDQNVEADYAMLETSQHVFLNCPQGKNAIEVDNLKHAQTKDPVTTQSGSFGVKVLVNGKCYGKKYGIQLSGNVNCTPDASDIVGTPNFPNFHIMDSAKVWAHPESSKAVGVYAAGYGVWLIEGYVHGSTGVYVKGGSVTINNATIESDNNTATGINGSTKSGVNAGGNAIATESNGAYAGNITVTISGESTVTAGANGYAIQDSITTAHESNVGAITITGGDFTGGASGCITVDNSAGESGETPQTINIELTGGTFTGDVETLIENVGENTIITEVVSVDDQGNATVVVGKADPTDVVVETPKNVVPTVAVFDAATEKSVIKLNGDTAGEAISITLNSLGKTEYEAKYLSMNGSASHPVTVTLPAGKTLEVGQIIMNENSQIVVEAGAKLLVTGSNGIFANSVNNLILKANATNQALFVLSPDVTTNRQPKASVEFVSNCYYDGSHDVWHRFATPIEITSAPQKSVSVSTYAKYLNDATNSPVWQDINAWTDIKPFMAAALTNSSAAPGVVYTFEGKLMGNVTDDLKRKASTWNYYGNSFMAPIGVEALLDALSGQSIDGTIYYWDMNEGHFFPVNAGMLGDFGEGITELKAMQFFVLRNRIQEAGDLDIDYANSVFNYNVNGGSPAPRRVSVSNANRVRINITAENGASDVVYLLGSDNYTAEYEDGHDAEKLMNEGLNVYVQGDMNYAMLATDEILGTSISMTANEAINYTMTFSKVNGEYALRDNMTGRVIAIVEGATYNFSAQPNEVSENRFEIVGRQEMPTAVETVDEMVNTPKAIYTIMGQYVGETTDWNNLPAGVYVVDGVKVVK